MQKFRLKKQRRYTLSTIRIYSRGCSDALGIIEKRRAIKANIHIMRAFVKMRSTLASVEKLSKEPVKIDSLKRKKHLRNFASAFLWSHQGLNLGPPDYESGATNQLSYRTNNLLWFGVVTEPQCKYNTFFD